MEYGIGSEVLGGWRITRVIGEGASGRVFEVEKSGFGIAAKSALKVVRIPPSPSMAKSMLSEGMDQDSVAGYFRGVVDDFAQEITLISSLSHPGLVTYQDHDIRPHDDGFGYDVLLRMELLEPLTDRMEKECLSPEDTVRLGIEVADALAYCHAHKVIHRDIKPGNIFLDQDSRFKIGDFGVSRTVEQTMGSFSHKGTEAYMAPEFYKGEAYGADVDVYALGLMMYQLLNGNRLPFLPPAPQPISFHDRESAKMRRLSGETLPPLPGCDANLFAVIAAACSPNNAQRPTAAGLRDQLEGLQPQAERIRATHGHADAEMSPEEDRTITGGPIRQPATGTPGSSAGPDAKGTETPGTSDGSSGAAQGPSAGEAEQPEPSRPARDDASEPAPPITETVGIWGFFGDKAPGDVKPAFQEAAPRPEEVAPQPKASNTVPVATKVSGSTNRNTPQHNAFEPQKLIQRYLLKHDKPESDATFYVRTNVGLRDDLTKENIALIRKNFSIAKGEKVLLAFITDNALLAKFSAGIVFTSRGVYARPQEGHLFSRVGELRFATYRGLPSKKTFVLKSEAPKLKVLSYGGQSFTCLPAMADWMKGLIDQMQRAVEESKKQG